MGSTNYCKYTLDNEFQCMVYITQEVLDVMVLNQFWTSRVLITQEPNVGMCFKIGIRKPYTEYGKYEMLDNIKKQFEKCTRLPIKKDMNIYLQIADDLPVVIIRSGNEVDAQIAANFRALTKAEIPRRTEAQSFNPCYFTQAFEVDPLNKIMEKEFAELRKPIEEYAPDKDKRIKELEEELRRLRGDYDAREQERDAAQAAFEEADKENVKLSAEIDALKEQINKLEEDKFDIGTSLEIEKGTVDQLQYYIDELEKKLNPPKPKPNEPRYITIKGVKYRV